MSELETIVLHEPIVLTEPTRARFLCAECFTPGNASAAVTIRGAQGGDWEIELGGAQNLEDAPDCHGLFVDDCDGVMFSRVAVRGFVGTGLLARGWRNGGADWVYASDCDVPVNLDYQPSSGGGWNENLDFNHLRLGDTWSFKHTPNVFRPGRLRGGNHMYVHSTKNVELNDLRTRGECFLSIKVTNNEDLTIARGNFGGIQVSGIIPSNTPPIRQATLIENCFMHKGISHSFTHGDNKVFMTADGAKGVEVVDCIFSAFKSPEEEADGKEIQIVQVTGESECTMRDVMILGPADVGFDWRATPTADFGGSELTLEGDLRIERCEVPFRMR